MISDPAFVKILETDSLTDIALIRSTLDAAGVNYFLQGENMKFIRPVDPVLLMVSAEDVEKAMQVLRPLKLSFNPFVFGGRHPG